MSRLQSSLFRSWALCGAAVVISAVAGFAVTPRTIADLPIPVPSGRPITLRQFRGKVVLMAVISKDCDPCIKSIDILNRIQKDFGPKGFQVIAAVGDPNAQYLLASFVKRYQPNFPVGYLNQDQIIRLGDLGKSAKMAFVPIFMFIDRKGVVQQQVTGNQPFFKTEETSTRNTIKALLSR